MPLLELIFQGFVEWIYGLILECWEYFASALLDIMSLDFAYIKAHVPVVSDMMQILLAVGWALLLGNLVFQAMKGMTAGLGFEGEDPKFLFARTFIFSFLLLASPQICDIALNITSSIMKLLDVTDAVSVHLVDDGIFGSLSASWVLVILFNLIVIFKAFGLLLKIAEQYVLLAVLTITSPLAFAMGGSRSTSEIFSGWCRMFGSMCALMVTNVVFVKMLFSTLSSIPSGLDALAWMALVLAIFKAAKKSDATITRIGLNPSITGQERSLAGALTFMVIRNITRSLTSGGGKPSTASPSGSRHGFYGSSRFQATAGTRSSHFRGGVSGQSTTQQGAAKQSVQQAGVQQSASSSDNSSKSPSATPGQKEFRPQEKNTRKSAVPPGVVRGTGHVASLGSAQQPGTAGKALPSSVSNHLSHTEQQSGMAEKGTRFAQGHAKVNEQTGGSVASRQSGHRRSPCAGQAQKQSENRNRTSMHAARQTATDISDEQTGGKFSEKKSTRMTHAGSQALAASAQNVPGKSVGRQPGTAETHQTHRQTTGPAKTQSIGSPARQESGVPTLSAAVPTKRQNPGPAQQKSETVSSSSGTPAYRTHPSPAQQKSGKLSVSDNPSSERKTSVMHPGSAGKTSSGLKAANVRQAARFRGTRQAFIFAGDSYESILTELERSEGDLDSKLLYYGDAFRSLNLPVHLLSCDDTGAIQLRLMSVPSYRKKLTRAALQEEFVEAPGDIPEWDALFRGVPFVMAADMDLRRIDAAIRIASANGYRQIGMAALADQIKTVLAGRYVNTGLSRIYRLSDSALEAVLGAPPVLHSPPRTQFLTEKGDVVDAPPFQTHRKAGGSG